jgi:hypothetical protein
VPRLQENAANKRSAPESRPATCHSANERKEISIFRQPQQLTDVLSAPAQAALSQLSQSKRRLLNYLQLFYYNELKKVSKVNQYSLFLSGLSCYL